MESIGENSRIRKVLQNEIAQIISIVAIVYSFVAYVILPIKSIEQEIVNIKTNHLHTIEMDMAELKALEQQDMRENTTEHKAITEELTKVATILDQHLKNTIK